MRLQKYFFSEKEWSIIASITAEKAGDGMETDKRNAALLAEGHSSPMRVTIVETGETFLSDAVRSLLENMRRLGKRGIPVGCRNGGCSVCKVEIISGGWRQCRPMSREYVSDEDLAAGRILACCITPTENVTLRILGKMRKALERASTSQA